MSQLSAASNVLAPAFYLLEEKDYKVSFVKEQNWWIAQKGDIQLTCYSTLELCGLAYIHEAKGDNWPVSDEDIEDYLGLEE
ncbi:hypothetical protein [Hymenobacter yonginensis]|uniref:Uncharacterized protein n=1 Tax=Hymenobacter yonginensis TaxID=748197 RepID=A0ABY7PHK1_9BACT|nr:hypothetical protein [Hymenobacter yonginensis]WBO82926.1 hypothetical protein O9Z63_11065 [Hymenobacter yonginensis]